MDNSAAAVLTRLARYREEDSPAAIIARLERYRDSLAGPQPALQPSPDDFVPRVPHESTGWLRAVRGHVITKELLGLAVGTLGGVVALTPFVLSGPTVAVLADAGLAAVGVVAVTHGRRFGLQWTVGCLIGLVLGLLS